MKPIRVSFAHVRACALALPLVAAGIGCPAEDGETSAVVVDAGVPAGDVATELGGQAGAGMPPGMGHGMAGTSAISQLAADAVILKVDGVSYTKARLDQAVVQTGLAAGIPPQMLDGASRVAFEKPAYEKLIERQLLVGEAKKRGLYPTLEEAEAATKPDRDRLIASLPPGKTFADALKELGSDEATFRAELQADVSIARLLDAIAKGIPTPPDDVIKKFYDDNKARMEVPSTASASHILLAVAPDATDADVKKATDALKALRAELKGKGREAFAKAAEEKSEDQAAKRTKGDLGSFRRGDLLPEIEKVAFALKDGEISEPLRSPRGMHLLFGQGTTEGRVRPFEEVKPLIADREKQKAILEAMDQLIESLRKGAKVERVVEPAKSPFDDGDGRGSQVPNWRPGSGTASPRMTNPHGGPPAGGAPAGGPPG